MGFAEFVGLTAAMQSMTALTIDAMLPALPEIGRDLGTSHPNDVQLVVLIMLLGFGLGQILYGPVSDSIGRKPPIYAGLWAGWSAFSVKLCSSCYAAGFFRESESRVRGSS